MTAFYNEIDPYAAQWLRNLITAGHIAYGVVDERSIEDINPDELRQYTQCHFFAGIGVWSRALRLAGWPDNQPVWTGSCPCQPFSKAGKGAGFADERHLWPAFHWLISQCRPPVVFGEQVASEDGLDWLDLVQADLEGTGYASAAVDICSAGVGAPHIRQRLYWVADSACRGNIGQCASRALSERVRCGEIGGVADSDDNGCRKRQRNDQASRYGDSAASTSDDDRQAEPGPTNGYWRDTDWLFCKGGKWVPVEPGTFPLAHGATSRVGRLRAYGNAIVPQVAQTFIESYLSTED